MSSKNRTRGKSFNVSASKPSQNQNKRRGSSIKNADTSSRKEQQSDLSKNTSRVSQHLPQMGKTSIKKIGTIANAMAPPSSRGLKEENNSQSK
jgi:hypothetical protein